MVAALSAMTLAGVNAFSTDITYVDLLACLSRKPKHVYRPNHVYIPNHIYRQSQAKRTATPARLRMACSIAHCRSRAASTREPPGTAGFKGCSSFGPALPLGALPLEALLVLALPLAAGCAAGAGATLAAACTHRQWVGSLLDAILSFVARNPEFVD